jgi:hypothetical protein
MALIVEDGTGIPGATANLALHGALGLSRGLGSLIGVGAKNDRMSLFALFLTAPGFARSAALLRLRVLGLPQLLALPCYRGGRHRLFIRECVIVALVVGVDSYLTAEQIVSRGTELGYGPFLASLAASDLDAFARLACQYLDLAWRWNGSRAVVGQPLEWPRSGVLDRDGVSIPSDVVPSEVLDAQVLLTVEQLHGPLYGWTGGSSREGRAVVRESADDASITYGGSGSGSRSFPMVNALLRHLNSGRAMGSARQGDARRG